MTCPRHTAGGCWRQGSHPGSLAPEARLLVITSHGLPCRPVVGAELGLGPELQSPCCSVPPPGSRAPHCRRESLAARTSACQGDSGRAGGRSQGQRAFVCLQIGQAGLGCAARPRGQSGANSLAGRGGCQGAGNNYRAELQPGRGSHTGRAAELSCLRHGPGFLGGRCKVCFEVGDSNCILADGTHHVLGWAHFMPCLLSSLNALGVGRMNSAAFTYPSTHSFDKDLLSAYYVPATC